MRHHGERRRAAASAVPGDSSDFDDVANSKFLSSEVIQAEIQDIMKTFNTVNQLLPKFFDWDLAGQRIFLDQMRSLQDRIRE